MNGMAATIASYGLLANSPAVVIGAMIVAMLMGPIVGISLALVDSDTKTLLKSLLSLLSGAVTVLATAIIIGALHKDIPMTSEILVRTVPNFLDLMIALAGGAAGAYATVSFRSSLALVGVAIATALVPPLSSASILLARGEVIGDWCPWAGRCQPCRDPVFRLGRFCGQPVFVASLALPANPSQGS